jgi:hypothetical protein
MLNRLSLVIQTAPWCMKDMAHEMDGGFEKHVVVR